MARTFDEWFTDFIAEKDIDFAEWEIEGKGGTHFISNGVVIEHISIASPSEKKQIKDILVKIDFANGDVNHFFKHLAKGLVANY